MAPHKITQPWRELSGINNWEALLDPLHPDLRQHIINYGELSQAVYDAFNDEEASQFTGAPRYGRHDFFDKVCLTAGRAYRYRVTKFVYATAGVEMQGGFILRSGRKEWRLKESNWMGYVAVATDEGKAAVGRRDVVVAWRGTVRPLEWVSDLQSVLVPAGDIVGGRLWDGGDEPRVYLGWKSIYTTENAESPFNKKSARDQVLKEIRRLIDLYRDEEVSITLTGHSLGAALAAICSMDIVAHGYNKPTGHPDRSAPVTAIVFASPHVGDAAFKKAFDYLAPDLRLLRITNSPDLVPRYPLLGYTEVGAELVIDAQKSKFMKSPGGPEGWHSLEAYMHGVAGTQGSNGEFKLVVDRDIALLNKYMDAVKDECMIPISWWVEKNKGMAQGKDGHWRLEDHEEDDDDVFMDMLLHDM
ncbi:phospholipase A1-II 1-like [Phalaenopsis equestris]|uniref:phospholipase A1-II 1-like n=1 Tax=Phalaenopsis equestris TaxID=78828 RepID=UPI0009E43F77|nr:phospholipase A1-II 1-like [Phalaenopsis equestris]